VNLNTTQSVRDEFVRRLVNENFVVDKTGVKLIEIEPADFIADDVSIFGEVNRDYVAREIHWYQSMSLNVNDIPGGPPEAWRRCADQGGMINSNYGWMAYSTQNHEQYKHVLEELRKNPSSRRTTMIYMRPEMWHDYQVNGRSDFCCTWGHTFHVRDDVLHMIVNMRSNDAWAGFRNDRAWAEYVQTELASDLDLVAGDIRWHADSLHFYEQQFYLVDHFRRTGEKAITKKRYAELYPDSPWNTRQDRDVDK